MIMNHQKEVWKFFRNDPICRVMVRFYEKVRFPVYAILTFTYLFLVPVLLNFILYGQIPDLKSKYFAGFFLIHGVLPIVGSYLGYKWLSSIIYSLRELVAKEILEEKYHESIEKELFRHCNKIIFLFLSFFFLALVVFYDRSTYMKVYGSLLSKRPVSDIYLLLTHLIWWYFIIKTGFVYLVTSFSYRNMLLMKASDGYVLRVSLYHPDTYYGLESIGKFCSNFLILYIGVIGGYLTTAIWGGLYRVLDPFMLGILGSYIGLPGWGFFCILWSSHQRMKEAKYEELKMIWQKINEIKGGEDYGSGKYVRLAALHEKVESFPTWPLGMKKATSILFTYWIPIISFAKKLIDISQVR